ncbi:hypothetical protein BKA67DRAFT_655165 [Truncatella angustata]|uniref:Uncharacterized protein n=1 Tax=Truncatella angustata TaxID=152316 RepID=A0A9P8UR01_9PEZI|nr:uncharacterized protein BKA67DRAFT_655165 [Truncatella angustata]KAH6656862.1 hypothetical protein BKA67DRAFT_655165 [Truncatella angustata]
MTRHGDVAVPSFFNTTSRTASGPPLAPATSPVARPIMPFGWFLKIGATPEAVAVLNDQTFLFPQLLAVLVIISLQITCHWYIHYATLKPEQKKKKEKKGAAKPPAAR